MNKPITTSMHALLDLATVGAMLTMPRFLNCSRPFAQAVTCMAVGKLAYSLLTRHELGVVRVISMKTHLLLDTVAGAGLALLPLLTDEDDPATYAACVSQGLFDIAVAPLTETKDVTSKVWSERSPEAHPAHLTSFASDAFVVNDR